MSREGHPTELDLYGSNGIPTGRAMRVVEVSTKKAAHVSGDHLFEGTSKEFERVRTSWPLNNSRVLSGMERAYHALRGRAIRPLLELTSSMDPTFGDVDVVLASPAARLSGGSGAFCVTAAAFMPGVYYGPDLPAPAIYSSSAKRSLQLYRANQQFIDLEAEQQGVAHFQLEPMGTITPEIVLSPEQRLGLAAAYLGLKQSSWA